MKLLGFSPKRLRWLQGRANLSCYRIQLSPAWLDRPIRGDSELVALVSREDVQVEVEHLLGSRLPVREEHVDTFTFEAGTANRCRESLANGEAVASDSLGQVSQIRIVLFWNYKNVARIHRTDRHEGDSDVVLVD